MVMLVADGGTRECKVMFLGFTVTADVGKYMDGIGKAIN